MIIDEIKKANIEAMRNKDANLRAVFGILINKHQLATVEARTTGKEVGDDEMSKIIQKTIKELTEEAANYEKAGNAAQAKQVELQRISIEKYLPQMLSEQDIYNAIAKMADKSTPNVMRTLKAEFGGKVDMKMAAEVLKKFN